MRWHRIAAAPIAALGVLIACVGDDPNGTTLVPDAAIQDVATASDTSANGDAAGGEDATTSDAADASSTICATTYADARFCDDFDIGSWKPAWAVEIDDGGGAVSVVTNPLHSAPFALSAKTTATGIASGIRARLAKTESIAGLSDVTFEARIRVISATDPDAGAGIPQQPDILTLTGNDTPFSPIALKLFATTQSVGCFLGAGQIGSTVAFALSDWHHVFLRAEVQGALVTVSCTIDGNERKNAPLTVTLGANATLGTGPTAFEGQPPMQIVYDTLVFRAN